MSSSCVVIDRGARSDAGAAFNPIKCKLTSCWRSLIATLLSAHSLQFILLFRYRSENVSISRSVGPRDDVKLRQDSASVDVNYPWSHQEWVMALMGKRRRRREVCDEVWRLLLRLIDDLSSMFTFSSSTSRLCFDSRRNFRHKQTTNTSQEL